MDLIPRLIEEKDTARLAGLLAAEDRAVRVEAARALGELQQANAVPMLLRATSDEDAEVRQAAGEAVTEFGPAPLIDALIHQDGRVRSAAREALYEIGDPAVPPLADALHHPDQRTRRAARAALSGMDTPVARAALRQEQLLRWAPMVAFGVGALLVGIWLITTLL